MDDIADIAFLCKIAPPEGFFIHNRDRWLVVRDFRRMYLKHFVVPSHQDEWLVVSLGQRPDERPIDFAVDA